jgi:hypothetical protein
VTHNTKTTKEQLLKEPAQKILVRKYLNWGTVKTRLAKYTNIAKLFPLQELQKCSEKAPFYCHYLGWRLGTWKTEEWFEFFDRLLEFGINLPGWDRCRLSPNVCVFENFWGFIWELQTANFFANYPSVEKTEWLRTGPDIKVKIESHEFFVECTTYRKSFGLEEFISELFRCISQEIRVEHIPCLKFSLPKNNEIGTFLDDLFSPYLDPSFLSRKIEEAQHHSPIILPVPSTAENFYVYLENQNAPDQDYPLLLTLSNAGDPAAYLEDALNKSIKNKAKGNHLRENRPNLLMINLLLGNDWQLAKALRPMPKPKFGEPFDGVLFTACSIDSIPTLQNSYIYPRDNSNPMKYLMKELDNL